MLVCLRNKTQKQIKRQFLFKQERGQALGIPGPRPLVFRLLGTTFPNGSGSIKVKASVWFLTSHDFAFNFLCFFPL